MTAPSPYPIAPFKEGSTPLAPWMTLALRHRHPRDNEIHFDEPTHIYTVQGSSKGFISVTTFLHKFFGHFDADEVITKMMRGRNWPTSKWFGMTREAIKAAWEANGREASEAGTAMHLGIEMVMNDAEGEVVAEVKDTKEWEYFWRYWKKDQEIWEPWRTEWEVWDADLKLAGSIDMVYRNKRDGTFAVYDWKRVKDLPQENKYQSGLGPLAHLPDTKYWQYTLQLNIYKKMLEKNYGIVISELALVVLHPNNKSYKKYPLNILNEEVDAMFEARRKAVLEGCVRPVVIEENFQEVEDHSAGGGGAGGWMGV